MPGCFTPVEYARAPSCSVPSQRAWRFRCGSNFQEAKHPQETCDCHLHPLSCRVRVAPCGALGLCFALAGEGLSKSRILSTNRSASRITKSRLSSDRTEADGSQQGAYYRIVDACDAYGSTASVIFRDANIRCRGVPVRKSPLTQIDVQALFDNAIAHQNAGQLAEAIVIYQQMIALEPDLPGVYSNLGHVFGALGRLSEAEHALRMAISLKPDFAEAFSNLGNTLNDLGRPEEALSAHRHAIRLNPGLSRAHSNLGVVLAGLGRLEEAEQAYRRAILLDSGSASAHGNLGLLLGELGRIDEARQAAQEAVRLAPDDPHHWRNLGWLKKFEVGDPDIALMEKLAKNAASLNARDRTELHFALAKAYEDTAQFDRAFRHLLEGNSLKRAHVSYNEMETLAGMGRLEETFTCELIREWEGSGEQSSVPIFIVGMLRSGSTLVEQILASHPQVFGAGELKSFGKAVASMPEGQEMSSGNLQTGLRVPGERLRDLGTRYLADLLRLAPDAIRITDKMPSNFLNLGLIYLALPNAAIIHTIRDPLDTCVSCFSKLFDDPQPHTYDLAELGRYYRSYRDLMAHWHRVLPPQRILDVHYEEVVRDPQLAARRIVAYCGLRWDRRCLDFHLTERPVRTSSAPQVRQPLYKGSAGRARPFQAFIGPLLTELEAPR